MSTVDLDALDELAYVLHEQGYCGEVCVCVDDARALLPVVQALVAKGAAAELRAAADAAHDEYSGWEAAAVVRARADALDPT